MNDRDLIEMFFSRTEEAITCTLRRYGAYLRTIVFNITGSSNDADECLNDTMFKLWNTIPPMKPEFFKGYIGAVARNVSLDYYRKNHAAKRGASNIDYVLTELEECLPDKKESVENIVESMDIAETISRYLSSVTKKKRYVFVKRYFYSEPVKTIALSLGSSESNVKTMLFRMRRELKDTLEQEGVSL